MLGAHLWRCTLRRRWAFWFGSLCLTCLAHAQVVDVPLGGVRQVTTGALPNLPGTFGSANDPKALFRLGPLVPGKRYMVTLTYNEGTNIGFAHSWVDGNPLGKNWSSMTGIGSGTGSRMTQGKEDKFLFTVHPASTSNRLFLVLRSTGRPLEMKVSLGEAPAGLSRESKDARGYYNVTDFDFDRTAPFKLTRISN